VGLIPKIVSTPIKWACKKAVHFGLLRFPGGKLSEVACTYCPELCRFSCPVAVASGDDTVTPSNKVGFLYKNKKWKKSFAHVGALWPIYACSGCGRCSKYCVYDVQVPSYLFDARTKQTWDKAANIAQAITDQEDKFGDLADELGDKAKAKERLASSAGNVRCVDEAKTFHYLHENGVEAELTWEKMLARVPAKELLAKLSGKKWLVHESVWFSRRMRRAKDIAVWVAKLESAGVGIVMPFENGEDCRDSGGEGAFKKLFPEIAARMAVELWERDKHRADGILCFSRRSAAHLKKSLGERVPVVFAGEGF
jgi:ferredoxin